MVASSLDDDAVLPSSSEVILTGTATSPLPNVTVVLALDSFHFIAFDGLVAEPSMQLISCMRLDSSPADSTLLTFALQRFGTIAVRARSWLAMLSQISYAYCDTKVLKPNRKF